MYNPFSNYRVTRTYQGHLDDGDPAGVDWGMDPGTPLPSCCDGYARYGYNDEAGFYVELVRADGSFTRYGHGLPHGYPPAHMIGQGELTAMLSGNSGTSTGPHLHAHDRDVNGVRRPPFSTGGAFAAITPTPLPTHTQPQREDDTMRLAMIQKTGKDQTLYIVFNEKWGMTFTGDDAALGFASQSGGWAAPVSQSFLDKLAQQIPVDHVGKL